MTLDERGEERARMRREAVEMDAKTLQRRAVEVLVKIHAKEKKGGKVRPEWRTAAVIFEAEFKARGVDWDLVRGQAALKILERAAEEEAKEWKRKMAR